ncbi:MAG: hypothetical protein TV41_06825 [Wolbachia endosymbiont of Dactylopius coccus]|nr:MAG: hypothetical protein TV41_06825 [Wolbachia endosymbiont of Dactylopius coccus]
MSILFELSRFGRNDEYKGSKMLRYKGGLSPLIDEAVRKRKKQVGSSWRDLYQFPLHGKHMDNNGRKAIMK